MKTEYPWQVNSVIHKTKAGTKTLGIDAMLFSPKEEDEVRTPAAPLEMHEGYSRFKGTLIVKMTGKDKKVLTFNIPAKSVPYIHKKTQMLIEQNMISGTTVDQTKKCIESTIRKTYDGTVDYIRNSIQKVLGGLKVAFPGLPEIELEHPGSMEGSGKEEDLSSSKAYTTVIKSGKLKDKIPALLLLEDSKNLTLLENQKKWLEDNLAKYPGNQEQIDGIKEAIELYKAGKLSPVLKEEAKSVPGTRTYVVYETACKNIQPVDKEGRWTIYQISIKYTPENNLPFTIEVMNCMAPVDKSKGNEIVMSKAVNKQTQDIRMSEEEWFTMIDSMKAIKIMFESLTYPDQLQLADKISKENYEASKVS